MVKIISDVSPYHEDYVLEEVEKLQANGYNVTRIEKVSREFLVFFGKNVTHIFYEN